MNIQKQIEVFANLVIATEIAYLESFFKSDWTKMQEQLEDNIRK